MNQSAAIREAIGAGLTDYTSIAKFAKKICKVLPSYALVSTVRRRAGVCSTDISTASTERNHTVPRRLKAKFPKVQQVICSKKGACVTVTAKDAKNSTPLDPTGCAMSIAATRQYNVDGAMIGMSTSYLIKGATAVRFKTPVSVQREITSFDRHGDFAPGEYQLGPVTPSARNRPDTRKRPGSKHIRRIVHIGTARVREFR